MSEAFPGQLGLKIWVFSGILLKGSFVVGCWLVNYTMVEKQERIEKGGEGREERKGTLKSANWSILHFGL